MTKPDSQTLVYFSAADRQTELFIDERFRVGAFEESLVHGVLFEPGILVPDVFHFISSGLWGHLEAHTKQNTTSLFEAAAAAGRIVPSYRDTGITSYRLANQFVDDNQLQGLLDPNKRDVIVAKLDAAAARAADCGKLRITYWPTTHSVGERFGQRLRAFFHPEVAVAGKDRADEDLPPVIDDPDIHKVWRETARWRGSPLLEALSLRPGDLGFRRGDYMNAIGRELQHTGKIHDMAELLNASKNPDEALALRVLINWINETYHYNQAMEFDLTPCWSRFHPQWSMATLNAMVDADKHIGVEHPAVVERQVRATLPPPSVLARLDGRKIVETREAQVAKDYFHALEAWKENPHEDALLGEVKSHFLRYCRDLTKSCGADKPGQQALLSLRLGHLSGPVVGLAATAGAAVDKLAPDLVSTTAPLIAVGSVGWAAYTWLTRRPRRFNHTVRTTGLALT